MTTTTRKSLSRPDPPKGGEGFSYRDTRPSPLTLDGSRRLAEMAMERIALEMAGWRFIVMRLPVRDRIEYAARLLNGQFDSAEAFLAEQGHQLSGRTSRRFHERLRDESAKVMAEWHNRPDPVELGRPDSCQRTARLALDRMHLKDGGSMPFGHLPRPLLEELAHRLLTPGAIVADVQDWLMSRQRVGRSSIYRFNQALRVAADEVMRAVPLKRHERRSSAKSSEIKGGASAERHL